MRIRLNKRGKYFKEDKYDIGHHYLRKLEKDVLPQWLKYLKTQKKNLILFIKQLNNKQILKRALNRSSFFSKNLFILLKFIEIF